MRNHSFWIQVRTPMSPVTHCRTIPHFRFLAAVEVSADTTLIYHSGTVPGPVNPDAERGSREYYGDTETQALNVFGRMEKSFEGTGRWIR